MIPETVDFTKLVAEQNKNMSIGIQSKLISALNNTFIEEEQRWYAANLYMFMNYHPTDDFPIDLSDVYEMIGFVNKKNAKATLKNNFLENEDYKILLARSREQVKTNGGAGLNKESIMLNTETFKNLCIIARTENGKKIRKYYVKLESVFNTLVKEQIDEQVKQKKEELLLREYSNECSLVYLIKVKTLEDGKYVLKIGESRSGINDRYKEHKKSYPECVLIDCFLVKNSKRLEKFVHKKYALHKYKELKDHEKENELFLVGEELSYQQILNTIKENIHSYNDTDNEEKLRLQIQVLELQNQNLELQISSIKNKKEVEIDYCRIRQIIKEEINFNRTVNITDNFNNTLPSIGPRVQQINPETLSLVKIYENVAEVCKHFKIPRSSLTKAYKENTIYKNYRWNFVDRNQDPNIISDLEPTKQLTKIYNLGYIAKLDSTRTKILNVFLDRKTASFIEGYENFAYLDKYVKENKKCGDFYYILYENVEESIKKEYLGSKTIVLYKSGVGQYDENGNLKQEFRSKHHCQQELHIGEKSLNKAILSGEKCIGFYYRTLDEKLYI